MGPHFGQIKWVEFPIFSFLKWWKKLVKVLNIAKNDFNVTRMQSIAQNDFLPNILVAKAFHFEDATRLIENLAKANFEKTKFLGHQIL